MEGLLYPVSAGVLLFLFLLFNHLPWLKNKKQLSYNVTNVIFMVLYYLGVWSCDELMISAVMMVLGAVTILTVFRERYGMAIPRKYLALAVFLTWSVLTGHYRSPVVVSILLMAIALMCVGIGFKLSDKTERIYGLVTAAFVCLKLVIYDFKEVGTVYRIAVFLTVGLVALIISFLYIQLEKAESQRAGQK